MKYTKVVDPSSTPQTVVFDTGEPVISVSGGTPLPPPVDPPPVNQSPSVNAGANQSIVLPVNSAVLSGSAIDKDGTISSLLWTQVSGPTATIETPTSATSRVSNLVVGNYVFKLTATDNQGGVGSQTTMIVVSQPQTSDDGVPAGYKATTINKFSTDADLNPGGHNQQGASVLNKTIFRSAPSSFESRVKSVSSGLRGEVQYSASNTGPEGGMDFWIYFPDYKKGTWGGHCAQFHPDGSNSGGSATVALYHTEGKFTVWRNLGGSNMFQGGSPTGGPMTIQPNTWYHVRFIIKWDRGTSGWIKCYINDMINPYFSFAGQTQSDNAIPFPKLGQNNFGAEDGMIIIYDDLTLFTKA